MDKKQKQNAAAFALLLLLAWLRPKEVVTATYNGPID